MDPGKYYSERTIRKEITMKTKIIYSILLMFLMIFIYGISIAQTPDQLFQKGIMKEEGEGSLKEAIELYKLVADNSSAEKILRAKALYQMGNCYEKLGQQEARGVYEKLVANYTDPQELVANAKRRLSKLNADQTTSSNSGIILRQIPRPGVDIEAYSPDGQYATYNDWNEPEIGVIDLKTGKKSLITKGGNWHQQKRLYPMFSSWSPDSKQIVYDWIIENPENDSDNNCELRIVNRDGSNERTLINNGKRLLLATDWSHDGSTILCMESTDNDSLKLILFSVKDGSKKIITEFAMGRNPNANFTNDENYIVFRARSDSSSENNDIFIVSKDGGEVTPLITNKEDDGFPLRIPGSNQFIYLSNHSGTNDLWSMIIENGKLVGEPKVLKSDFNQTTYIIGATADGTLFYTSKNLNPEIYKSKLDFDSKQAETKAISIVHNSSRKIMRVIWSPDFHYIAGLVETPFDPIKGTAPLKMVIQNVQTGDEYDLSPDLGTNIMQFYNCEPQWSQDGKSIFIKGKRNDEKWGMYKIDVKTGNVSIYKMPLEHAAWEWRWLQFLPDGETQYFVSKDGFLPKSSIIARSVKTGEEQKIKEFENLIGRILLSPDGKTLAIQKADTLFYMPVDGHGELKKIDAFESIKGTPVGWSADNKSVYIAKNDAQKGLGIWSISLNNEPAVELISPEKLKEFKGAEGLKISTVGNDVYLTMQNGAMINEYWAVENIAQK